MQTIILKLGGSLLSPYETSLENLKAGKLPFDFDYARKLVDLLKNTENQIILLIGGGFLNRWYLAEFEKANIPVTRSLNDLHTIGIASSVVNASVFKILLQEALPQNDAVYPEVIKFGLYDSLPYMLPNLRRYRFIVGSGGKVGHSHDFDAIMFAELFKVDHFFSLKNIDGIYTADPKKDPTAKKIDNLTWKQYQDIIKVHVHTPGANLPIDAVAAELAERKNIGCFVGDGRHFDEVAKVIAGGTPSVWTKVS